MFFQEQTFKTNDFQLEDAKGQRGEFLEHKMNAFGDAQEALADKVERLIKLRAPATFTVPRKGHVFQTACQKTRNKQMAPQPIMNTPCRSQWMTEYKENFGFLQTVHSPPASKKGMPPLPINLLDHPEARFADKYRRTQYQTAYGCKAIAVQTACSKQATFLRTAYQVKAHDSASAPGVSARKLGFNWFSSQYHTLQHKRDGAQ
ncbi:hypothetical protein Baya_2240 [Bagarius yarrelli]|uniref:Uncharacterized protein n=1 Tax=Bagarius yarrelli TaxID=175774 RepID=A0A556TNF9_BAGYA|nr:hypothetical protein Baya_2240 [Bagarius yarrelli]